MTSRTQCAANLCSIDLYDQYFILILSNIGIIMPFLIFGFELDERQDSIIWMVFHHKRQARILIEFMYMSKQKRLKNFDVILLISTADKTLGFCILYLMAQKKRRVLMAFFILLQPRFEFHSTYHCTQDRGN